MNLLSWYSHIHKVLQLLDLLILSETMPQSSRLKSTESPLTYLLHHTYDIIKRQALRCKQILCSTQWPTQGHSPEICAFCNMWQWHMYYQRLLLQVKQRFYTLERVWGKFEKGLLFSDWASECPTLFVIYESFIWKGFGRCVGKSNSQSHEHIHDLSVAARR